MVVAEYFSRHFDEHARRLTVGLKAKLDVMVEALEREFGTAVELQRPEGGIFLWLRLPEGVDVRALVAPAAVAGVAFNPGPEWSADPEAAAPWLRLCFALPSPGDIRDGVAAFARVAPRRSACRSAAPMWREAPIDTN